MSGDPIGDTIRAHRARLRVSQVELAAMSDVSRATIARIETGKPATGATLERLAGPLGLPPRWYLDPASYLPAADVDTFGVLWTLFRLLHIGPTDQDLALIEALVVARERTKVPSRVSDLVMRTTLDLRRLATM